MPGSMELQAELQAIGGKRRPYCLGPEEERRRLHRMAVKAVGNGRTIGKYNELKRLPIPLHSWRI